MKAEELRIGNFVNLYGDDCRIQTVGMWVHTDTTVDEAPVDAVKPIPLSEEWLVKFGFGKSDECERGYNTHKHFGFYYDWHFKQFKLEVDDGANVVDIPMQIHYVHQLQNLYFSLTSEELTLK